MKRIFLCLLTLAVLVAALACTATAAHAVTIIASGDCGENGSNVKWTLDSDGKLTIFGTGKMKNYDWGGAPWCGYNVTTVEIKSGVTNIGNFAFEFCDSMTSVEIPNSVTTIGDYAFHSCDSLTSVEIPNSVTSIGDSAFEWCSSLTSVTIPNSVTSIGSEAFKYCTSLTSVTIGNSVTSIGEHAFAYCRGLTSVIIGNSVTSIGDSAFWYCSKLASATFLGNAPESFGYAVFYDTADGFTIYYPMGATGWTTPTWNGYPTVPMAAIIASGDCGENGDNVQWILDENGKVTIFGTGKMRDYTKGTDSTHFSPADDCTRAEAVMFLYRAAGSPKVAENVVNPFVDVGTNRYYYNAVMWAVANNITNGTDATHFSPNEKVSRASFVTFLWRAKGSHEGAASVNFKDVSSGRFYAKAVAWAVAQGITSGTTSTTFAPDALCTRGHVVTFLNRAYPDTPRETEYVLVVDNCSWSEAQKKAAEMGGQLATFEDEADYVQVLAQIELEKKHDITFRVGARRDEDSWLYYWVDKENQCTGEPVNTQNYWLDSHWLAEEPSFSADGAEERFWCSAMMRHCPDGCGATLPIRPPAKSWALSLQFPDSHNCCRTTSRWYGSLDGEECRYRVSSPSITVLWHFSSKTLAFFGKAGYNDRKR